VGVWAQAMQALQRARATQRWLRMRLGPANAAQAQAPVLANFGGFIVGLAVGFRCPLLWRSGALCGGSIYQPV